MFRVKIVGAGQLGSRHLQALKAVKYPLDIQVIDPSEASLQVAKERYDAVESGVGHAISFATRLRDSDCTDVAIIATSSDVRRQAIDHLFDLSKPRFLILEKLLFNTRQDYAYAESRFAEAGTMVWVNCPMRVMPCYEHIRQELTSDRMSYRVTGSQFGLVTNAIHYLDHVVHLSGCGDFELSLGEIDSTPIKSKRPSFLELNGRLRANFANGTTCEMTCYPTGTAPILVEIFTENQRYVVRESEGKLWHAEASTNWVWNERVATIPYQSQLTTEIVESLLASGGCGLTPYASSVRTHLSLLDPLRELIRAQSCEVSEYPFT
ncbi:oxidoreductase domain-containing protein [Solidesulfovibrio fructosivorans JJ]]|uniref:Oxidoreductase domain-containing protein n=1 Tax=Solidesulfovibrio fructosivorans JJ] TaxID=596151 RepID=E1JXQ6_SOLFR|nr:Gfo/Idh/MocA family oxidoreductase [Solidesulfovibrio fructosivorans]EFL50829.1 oxidoreductase domain-containing protein [Solidesulfovibrio fructosivorans JJ]]